MLSVSDPGTPNSARVWDYWLGGKDNYASDRVFGDRVLAAIPRLHIGERRVLGAIRLAGHRLATSFLTEAEASSGGRCSTVVVLPSTFDRATSNCTPSRHGS